MPRALIKILSKSIDAILFQELAVFPHVNTWHNEQSAYKNCPTRPASYPYPQKSIMPDSAVIPCPIGENASTSNTRPARIQ